MIEDRRAVRYNVLGHTGTVNLVSLTAAQDFARRVRLNGGTAEVLGAAESIECFLTSLRKLAADHPGILKKEVK